MQYGNGGGRKTCGLIISGQRHICFWQSHSRFLNTETRMPIKRDTGHHITAIQLIPSPDHNARRYHTLAGNEARIRAYNTARCCGTFEQRISILNKFTQVIRADIPLTAKPAIKYRISRDNLTFARYRKEPNRCPHQDAFLTMAFLSHIRDLP